MNKTLVNFPFFLDATELVESNFSPKLFNLVGCVNRADINGKEHYVSFTKDLKSDNWIYSEDDHTNITDKSNAINYGIPILLFYSSVE